MEDCQHATLILEIRCARRFFYKARIIEPTYTVGVGLVIHIYNYIFFFSRDNTYFTGPALKSAFRRADGGELAGASFLIHLWVRGPVTDKMSSLPQAVGTLS